MRSRKEIEVIRAYSAAADWVVNWEFGEVDPKVASLFTAMLDVLGELLEEPLAISVRDAEARTLTVKCAIAEYTWDVRGGSFALNNSGGEMEFTHLLVRVSDEYHYDPWEGDGSWERSEEILGVVADLDRAKDLAEERARTPLDWEPDVGGALRSHDCGYIIRTVEVLR